MKLRLSKNKKYILGCSSGPDSMALFHMLYSQGYDFVVVNVDYNYREGSKEETDLVEAYCKSKKVRFFTKNVQFSTIFGNFEAWARKIRYDFFMEVGTSIDVFDILIAHQQDDLIETYLMQEERGGLVSIYGLSSVYKRKNFYIRRPLLDYSKKQLIKYCEDNNVPYIIDPTNADTSYRRNYYRTNVIQTLTPEQRKKMLRLIKEQNQLLNERVEIISKDVVLDLMFPKYRFSMLTETTGEIALSLILTRWNMFFPISKGLVKDMQFAIKKNAKSYEAKLTEDIYFVLDSEYIGLVNDKIYYEIPIDENFESNGIFKINNQSSRAIDIKKIPNLKIKPAKLGSFYKIGGVEKKINRIFIDFKLPQSLRNIWPGIFDENDNLIYMPRYRKEYEISSESVLIFDLENLIKYIEKTSVIL